MILAHAGQTSFPCATVSVDDFGSLVQIGTVYVNDVCSILTVGEAIVVSRDTMMHATRELLG